MIKVRLRMQTDELLYIITTKAQRAHTYSQIYGLFFFKIENIYGVKIKHILSPKRKSISKTNLIFLYLQLVKCLQFKIIEI